MNLMEVWMSIVGISMSVGALPQAYRLWKRKTSGDISITLWIVMIHGLVWWLIYGIYLGSTSLIVTNSVCLVLDCTILTMIIKYRKKRTIVFGSVF
jgi:MtN3 and saliva related transmembrane protein